MGFKPRPYPLLGLHLNMSLWASLGHEAHFVMIIIKIEIIIIINK